MLVSFIVILQYTVAFGQIPFLQPDTVLPIWQETVEFNRVKNQELISRKSAVRNFDTIKWVYDIDSTWGTGVSTYEKLRVFDTFWSNINSTYPCFIHLPNWNWDSIVTAKRNEIMGGVSAGRFAGIMSDLRNYINDGHTIFWIKSVNNNPVYPGKPFFRGHTGQGACLTTLQDTLPLVYEAQPNHPYGLERGDVILGYNGIRWHHLVKLILRQQLPHSITIGSTPAATNHRYIQAVLANRHLFDTIDILKCNGNVIHLPTSLMEGFNSNTFFCTEQITPPSLYKLTYSDYYTLKRRTTSGLIGNNDVGYVALYDCSDVSGDTLFGKISDLIENNPQMKGLIIDIRTNNGGSMGAFYKAFRYLYHGGTVSWTGYGERDNPYDRMSLIARQSSTYDLVDSDPNSYESPIAILCGPNAASAGDFLPLLFSFHPHVKLFGKSTGGAFGSIEYIQVGTDYIVSKQRVNFYSVRDNEKYLSHTECKIDFPGWHTQDAVCKGNDDVIIAALNWINKTSVNNEQLISAHVKVFPNPTTGNVRIDLNLIRPSEINILLFDNSGKQVMSLKRQLEHGFQSIDLPLQELNSGLYYLHINDGLRLIKKKIQVR